MRATSDDIEQAISAAQRLDADIEAWVTAAARGNLPPETGDRLRRIVTRFRTNTELARTLVYESQVPPEVERQLNQIIEHVAAMARAIDPARADKDPRTRMREIARSRSADDGNGFPDDPDAWSRIIVGLHTAARERSLGNEEFGAIWEAIESRALSAGIAFKDKFGALITGLNRLMALFDRSPAACDNFAALWRRIVVPQAGSGKRRLLASVAELDAPMDAVNAAALALADEARKTAFGDLSDDERRGLVSQIAQEADAQAWWAGLDEPLTCHLHETDCHGNSLLGVCWSQLLDCARPPHLPDLDKALGRLVYEVTKHDNPDRPDLDSDEIPSDAEASTSHIINTSVSTIQGTLQAWTCWLSGRRQKHGGHGPQILPAAAMNFDHPMSSSDQTPAANGYVAKPVDAKAYKPVADILAHHCDGLAKVVTEKALGKIVEDYAANSIRWTRPLTRAGTPNKQRRNIHLGDWFAFVSSQAKPRPPAAAAAPEKNAQRDPVRQQTHRPDAEDGPTPEEIAKRKAEMRDAKRRP